MNYRELTFLYFAFWFWQYQVCEDDCWSPDQDEKCAAEQLEAVGRGLA